MRAWRRWTSRPIPCTATRPSPVRAGRAPRDQAEGRASDTAVARAVPESASVRGRSGGGEECRAGRCPPSRTPASPRRGLQVPAGSPRSHSSEDGLGGPLLCARGARRLPGMRRCSDCGFGEASLTRHLCQLSYPGCLILAAGTVRSGFLPAWGGGGGDGHELAPAVLSFFRSLWGKNEVSRNVWESDRVTWIAPLLVAGNGMAGDRTKVFFRRMPSLEKVNECLPSSPASAFALRDSFDRRENDKVVELSEGQPLSCWRMTPLSVLFLIN